MLSYANRFRNSQDHGSKKINNLAAPLLGPNSRLQACLKIVNDSNVKRGLIMKDFSNHWHIMDFLKLKLVEAPRGKGIFRDRDYKISRECLHYVRPCFSIAKEFAMLVHADLYEYT